MWHDKYKPMFKKYNEGLHKKLVHLHKTMKVMHSIDIEPILNKARLPILKKAALLREYKKYMGKLKLSKF